MNLRVRLSADQAARAKKLAPAVGPGIIFAVIAGYANSAAFYPAMWAATAWMTAIAIGAGVFVMIQQGTRSSRAVVARRPMEWMSLGISYLLVHWLFLLAAHKYTLAW